MSPVCIFLCLFLAVQSSYGQYDHEYVRDIKLGAKGAKLYVSMQDTQMKHCHYEHIPVTQNSRVPKRKRDLDDTFQDTDSESSSELELESAPVIPETPITEEAITVEETTIVNEVTTTLKPFFIPPPIIDFQEPVIQTFNLTVGNPKFNNYGIETEGGLWHCSLIFNEFTLNETGQWIITSSWEDKKNKTPRQKKVLVHVRGIETIIPLPSGQLNLMEGSYATVILTEQSNNIEKCILLFNGNEFDLLKIKKWQNGMELHGACGVRIFGQPSYNGSYAIIETINYKKRMTEFTINIKSKNNRFSITNVEITP